MSKPIWKRREWFNGKRLSTDDQDEYVTRVLADPDTRYYESGDSLIQCANGFITVYRQDYHVQLTSQEYTARPWLDKE